GHLLGNARAELGVEAAQQALAAVGELRLHAKTVEARGELERDVAAADHHRALRQPLEVEGLVGSDGVLEAGQRRLVWPAAGSDEDMPSGDGFSVDRNRVRIHHLRATVQDLDPGVLQHPFVDAVEPRDLPVLVGEQRLPVETRLSDRPAIGGGDVKILAPVRGVGEELLRDAADVDAGAAEAIGFGDRDLRAVSGGNAAGANAARAASDGEEVVVELQGMRYYFRFLRLSSTSSSVAVIFWCCGLSASHLRALATRVSIWLRGMPSTPANMAASSARLLDWAAVRASASLPSIALRSRLVTIRIVL